MADLYLMVPSDENRLGGGIGTVFSVGGGVLAYVEKVSGNVRT